MDNQHYSTPENGINPGDIPWENFGQRTGTLATQFPNDAGNPSVSSASVNRTRRSKDAIGTNSTISRNLLQYIGNRTGVVIGFLNRLTNDLVSRGGSLTEQVLKKNQASLGDALQGYLNHLNASSRKKVNSRNQTQNTSSNERKIKQKLNRLRASYISDLRFFFNNLQNAKIIDPQHNPLPSKMRVNWHKDNVAITPSKSFSQSSRRGRTVSHICHPSIAPYVTNSNLMTPLLAYLAERWNVVGAENVSSQNFSNNQNTLLEHVNTYVSNSLANEKLSSSTQTQKNNGRSNFNAALKDLFSGLHNAGSITINPFPNGCTMNWTSSGLKVTPGLITTSSTPQISAQDQDSATVTQPSQDSQADSQSGALGPAAIPFSVQPQINSLAAQQCLDPRGTTTPNGGLYERLWVNVHPAHVAPGNATQLNVPLDYPDFEGGPYWTQNIDPNTNAWNGTLTGHNTNGLNSIDLPGHAHITLMPGGYIAHSINPAQPLAPSQSTSQISSNDDTHDFGISYRTTNDYSSTHSSSGVGSDEIRPQDSVSNPTNSNSDDPVAAISTIVSNNPEFASDVLNMLMARLNSQNIHTANTQFPANPLPNPQNDIGRLHQANAGQYQAPENARYQPYQNPRGPMR